MRLQKYLADCGVASRRNAEKLILEGKVKLNGTTITELGVKVDPDTDIVQYMGQTVKPAETLVYIMLHKPEGYVCTAKDQFDRPAVVDLVKDVPARVFPVGRLDYDTSGLLLLTNDGDLTYRLTHPKHNIEKVYIAKILGKPSPEAIEAFKTGVDIGGYITAACNFEVLNSDEKHSNVRITLHEGKNRQVRKMCDAINHHVVFLKRIATGKLFLGELKRGQYRALTKNEISYLKSL